jgi:hypothetical protein
MLFGGFLSNLANFNLAGLLGSVGDTVATSSVISQLRYRIDQIRAPGVSLVSADVQRYGAGTTQKMPVMSQFNEISISMTSDGLGDIWQFWYTWLRGINEFTGTTSSLIGVGTSLPSYTTEYKDNYSTTIELIIYDLYGNPTIKIDLFEAFPTAIRDVPLSWGDQGNLLHLNINISYSDFTIVGANFASPYTISNAVQSIGSLINGAYMNNTYTGLLNSSGGLFNSLTSPINSLQPQPDQQSSGVGIQRENINI